LLLQVSLKLTEITFHLLVCQIKSHFFLIPFLIFFYQATARCRLLFRRQLVYNTTNYFALSSIFFNFFHFFQSFFKSFPFFSFFLLALATAFLYYHFIMSLSNDF